MCVSCRSTATSWISNYSGRKYKAKPKRLCVASWNVRTLLDTNNNNPERRSAIIAHELQQYNIDIAALSETRIPGESQFDEVAAGYTFLLIGHPSNGPSQDGAGFNIHSSLIGHPSNGPSQDGAGFAIHSSLIAHPSNGPSQDGAGFAIRSSLLKRVESRPIAHSPRLMSCVISHAPGSTITLVSAYAPTLASLEDAKYEFYEQLDHVLTSVPYQRSLKVIENGIIR